MSRDKMPAKTLRLMAKHEPYIRRLIDESVGTMAPKKIEINFKEKITNLEAKLRHNLFEDALKAITCGPVALVGPAGAGKTTLAQQVAEALKVKFAFTGAISSEYKLMGFIDANGRYNATAFFKAYTEGGLFLFDEIDGSVPQAVLAFNNAIANDSCDFPHGNFAKHKDFYIMAAANTYWTGADRVYVGRNQLDGASLDRFIFITVDYDEVMENKFTEDSEWAEHVQLAREAVKALKMRYIISPRATIFGAKLRELKMKFSDVEKMTLFKAVTAEDLSIIRKRMREIAEKGMEKKPASA